MGRVSIPRLLDGQARRPLLLRTLLAVCLLVLIGIFSKAYADAPPTFLSTWGSQGSAPGQFSLPGGVAVDSSGNLYVVEIANHRVQKFDSSGTSLTMWGSEGTGNGQFSYPAGVAVDSGGNVYVADQYNHRVQKFDSTGTFLAKWGSEGNANGEFRAPAGVAVDSSGNLYVADTFNHRVQKFDSTGTFIATWGSEGGGNGQFRSPSGMAVDSSGNLYVADSNNHRIQKFDSTGTFVLAWGGQGSGDGSFVNPHGLAVDSSGNVYVTDRNNHRLQKFDGTGSLLTVWGSHGNDDGRFYLPHGVAVVGSETIYVADTGNDRIQKFAPTLTPTPTPTPTTVDAPPAYLTQWGSLGSGDDQFNTPRGAAVDSSGNVYVADTNNHRIQKFDSTGTFLTSWGSQGGGNGFLKSPYGVAVDSSGNVYVADTDNSRIQKFNSTGDFLAVWGRYGSGNSDFKVPTGVAVDSNGNVYVADIGNHRIQKYSNTGSFLAAWGEKGSNNDQFDQPWGVAVDSSNNLYVADYNNHRIQKFDSDGVFLMTWGSQGSGGYGQLSGPSGVAVDSDGNVYVADSNNSRIQKFDSDGVFRVTLVGHPSENMAFSYVAGVAVDSSDNLYVVDSGNNRIQKFAPSPTAVEPSPIYLTQWGSQGSRSEQFNAPFNMAVDSSGNVYVADTDNHRIQKFDSAGTFLTTWGSQGSDNEKFNGPRGVAVDSNGNVYVADRGNHRIQKFTSAGTFITTLRSDDQFALPNGVAVDSSGNVYVADTENHRIQKFNSYGNFLAAWGSHGTGDEQFIRPQDVAVDSSGNVYISDTTFRIKKFDSSGNFLWAWGGQGSGNGQFNSAPGVAVDSNSNVYATDYGNNRVQKFDNTGTFLVAWGSQGSSDGQFVYPADVAVDSSGNIYVVEAGNHRVQKFAPSGGITPTPTATAITYDYGDAPDPSLQTLLSHNGARHLITELKLGTQIDADTNGQPNVDATGDDLNGDDEDGIELPAVLPACSSVFMGVTVSGSGYLNGWIDWNGDGDWADEDEAIYPSPRAMQSSDTLLLPVPCTAQFDTPLAARFRYAPGSSFSYEGLVVGGEVEDYMVTVERGGSVAVADSAVLDEDTEVILSPLANDNDPNGGALTLQSVTTPLAGSAVIVGDTIRYTPDADYNGTDTFRYTVVNEVGNPASARVSILIRGINDGPTDVGLSETVYTVPAPIDENDAVIPIPVGTTLGNLQVSDADRHDSHTFTISELNVAGALAINNQQLLVLSELTVPVANPVINFKLTVKDSSGLTFAKTFSLPVHFIAVPSPTGIGLSNNHLAENLPTNTLVGTLQSQYTAGTDLNGPHTYTLVTGSGSDDNAKFTIIGNELRTTEELDYEAKNQLSVRVRVEDSNQRRREQALKIQVDNDTTEPIDQAPPNCKAGTVALVNTNDALIEIRNIQFADPSIDGCDITGIMKVRVKSSVADNIPFTGYVDQKNQLYSGERAGAAMQQRIGLQAAAQRSVQTIDAFTIQIAGLTLEVAESEIEYYLGRASLRVSASNLCMPGDWGGLCVSLPDGALLIDSSGFKPSSVEVELPIPELSVGNSLTISSLQGKLVGVAGGYEISASGEFGLPKIKAQGESAGCTLPAAVTIYVDGFGNTVANVQAAAPTAVDGVALREVSIGLQCDKGIPIDATGLELTGVSGTLSLRPGDQYIELGLTIETMGKLGDKRLATFDTTGRLMWDPEWGFDIAGTVKVLSTFEMASAEVNIRNNRTRFRGEMRVVIAKASLEINAWSDHGSFSMTGRGKVQIGIAKGSIWSGGENQCKTVGRTVCTVFKWIDSAWNFFFGWLYTLRTEKACNWVVDTVCTWVSINIPPWDLYLPSINGDFGKFRSGNWGAKGYFGLGEVIGDIGSAILSRLGVPRELGFYVDHRANWKLGNVTSYQLMTPPDFAAALQRFQARQGAKLAGASLAVDKDTKIAINAADHATLQIPIGQAEISAATVISQVQVSEPSTVTFLLASTTVMTPALIAPDGTTITPDNYASPAVSARYKIDYSNSVIYEQFNVDGDLDTLLPRLRLVPAATFAGVDAIDVLVDGNVLWRNVPLLDSDGPLPDSDNPLDYVNIEPGEHTITIVPAGQSTTLASATLDALPTMGYSLLLSGNPPTLTIVDNKEKVYPTEEQIFVRFAHVADRDRRVNVLVNGTPYFSNIAFGELTSYRPLPTGAYILEIKDAVSGVALTPARSNQSIGAGALTIVLADVDSGGYTMEYASLIDALFMPRHYAVYNVGGADIGNWQVDVTGDLSDPTLTLAVLAYGMPTQLKNVQATAAGTNQVDVSWGVVADYAPTQITIYANPGEITSTLTYTDDNGIAIEEVIPQYSGIPLSTLDITDPAKLSGAQQSAQVDLSGLPSGTYHLWVDADDGVNPSVHEYAKVSGNTTLATFTVDHSSDYPTTWSPQITKTVDAATTSLALTWDALDHPDADSYTLHLASSGSATARTHTGLSQVYTYDANGEPVGAAYVYDSFDNMVPGTYYTLTIEARSESLDKSVSAAPVHIYIEPGQYQLTPANDIVRLLPGEEANVEITLDVTTALFYPNVNLGLKDQLLPRGISVQFANSSDGPPTLRNNPAPGAAATNLAANASTTLQIVAAGDVPTGTYPVAIVGYNAQGLEQNAVVTIEIVGATNLGEGNKVSQDGVTASYNPAPTTCATLGELPIHTVNPTLRNSSSDNFRDLYFVLTELDYTEPQGEFHPTLCNADGGNGGRADARLTFALTGDLADNRFAPAESVIPAFEVGLPVRKRYRIFGNLYGTPATVQAADEELSVQHLGTFGWEFDDEGNLIDSSVQVFLPFVAK